MHPNDIQRIAAAALAVLACSLLRPGIAKAEQHIVCPAAVDSRQVRVGSPDGWVGLFGPEGTLPLQNAQAIFAYGSLRDSWGELKDPPMKKKGKETIVTYPLPPDGDKYVVCEYGSRVYQAVKLPETTKECSFTYRRVQDALEPRPKLIDVLSDITCK